MSLSVRPVDQQRRQLALRFYCKWYSVTSGVEVVARRFWLASNRYIVCESETIKVCQYQVMISIACTGNSAAILKIFGGEHSWENTHDREQQL